MLATQPVMPESSRFTSILQSNLELKSTLQELLLSEFQIEVSNIGMEVAHRLKNNSELPGVILTENGHFFGMISRRRFWEHMSRPYSLELFSKRPLKSLYGFTQADILVLDIKTSIVEAAKIALQRSPELLYEPLVVRKDAQHYCLLDVHQLLLAQSRIHEMTSQRLDEQTYAHQVQTEKMASLGRTLAGVAHEIRNPVNAVNGNIEFLAEYYQNIIDLLLRYQQELDNKSEEIVNFEEEIELDYVLEDAPNLLKSLKLSAERLTTIVASLHNFSRLDESKHQLLDVRECIESILLILNNRLKNKIEVVRRYQELQKISCYSGPLGQVLMNLLVNAIDALMERKEKERDFQPKITISTALLEAYKNGPGIEIRIADNGWGIPSEIQDRIFEDFFTTKPAGKGTGLGLAISHKIVTEKHGGEIRFRSQVNIGTEFDILLPAGEEIRMSYQ